MNAPTNSAQPAFARNPSPQHFIDDYMLDDQARDVKRVATLVSQLRRVGAGHGTWDIDRQLYDKYGSASAGGTEPL